MISSEQRAFIGACVFDHGGDPERTALALGVRASVLHAWLVDPDFAAHLDSAYLGRLKLRGLNAFRLADKLMTIINANIADFKDVASLDDLARLGHDVTYPVQTIKQFFDRETGERVSIEIKLHDKLKAAQHMIEKVRPIIDDVTRGLGGGDDDERLNGVMLELPAEVLAERGLLPSADDTGQDDDDMLDKEMEAWLNS
jgi:hypothetical protein